MTTTSYQPALRQSSCKDCINCPRLYFYKYRWGLKPRTSKPSSALSCGTILHMLMEYGESGIHEVEKQIQENLNAIETIIDTPGADPLGVEAARHKYLLWGWQKALMMARLFWESHPLPSTLKVVAQELQHKMNVTVNNRQIPLTGIIDMLILDTRKGVYYNRDFKTTSEDVNAILTAYQYGLQCRFYRLLAADYVKTNCPPASGVSQSVPGFIIDILQVPNIIFCSKDKNYNERQKIKRDGSIETVREYYGDPVYTNYITRCREWYKERGKEASNSYFITYAESPLPDELIRALLYCDDHRTLPAEPGLFSRDLTGATCRKYNRLCAYYPLCSTPEAAWPSLIEQQYIAENPEAEPDVNEETTEEDNYASSAAIAN